MSLRRVNSSFFNDKIEKLLHCKFLSLEDELFIIEIKIKNTGISNDLNYGLEINNHVIKISPLLPYKLHESTEFNQVGIHFSIHDQIIRFCVPKQDYIHFIQLELMTDSNELVLFKGFPVVRRNNPYGCFLFYILQFGKESVNKMAKHSNIDLSSYNILSKSKKIPGRCKLNPDLINLHSDDVVVIHKKIEYFFSPNKELNILLFKRFFLNELTESESNDVDQVISKYTTWLFEYNKHKSFEIEIKQKKFVAYALFLSAILRVASDFLGHFQFTNQIFWIIFGFVDFSSHSSTYIFAYLGTRLLLYQLALKYEHDTFKEQFERLNILSEGFSFKDTQHLLDSMLVHLNKAERIKQSQSFQLHAIFQFKSQSFLKQFRDQIKNEVLPSKSLTIHTFLEILNHKQCGMIQNTAYYPQFTPNGMILHYSNSNQMLPHDLLLKMSDYHLNIQFMYYKSLNMEYSECIYLLYFISHFETLKQNKTLPILKSNQVLNIKEDLIHDCYNGTIENTLKYIGLI
eukprot:NODE_855_length_3523_cov_0.310164.p1 type:complete len:515 gc:universal NODE_855_length_3523_cov_0.310164:450-1994(+)